MGYRLPSAAQFTGRHFVTRSRPIFTHAKQKACFPTPGKRQLQKPFRSQQNASPMATLEAVPLGRLLEALFDRLSPAALCQAFFVLAAAGVLGVAATPPSARRLLLEYGPRQSASSAPKYSGVDDAGPFTRLASWATSVGKVPHSWFIHFYVLSVLSSIFWALEFVTQGPVLNAVARAQAQHATASMTVNQVFLAWLLMLLQGARRLYEYFTIIKPSASRMWVVHWLLGTSYYFCMGISVWVEGSGKYTPYDGPQIHPHADSAQDPFWRPALSPCARLVHPSARLWVYRFSCMHGRCNTVVSDTCRGSKSTRSQMPACSAISYARIIRVNVCCTSRWLPSQPLRAACITRRWPAVFCLSRSTSGSPLAVRESGTSTSSGRIRWRADGT